MSRNIHVAKISRNKVFTFPTLNVSWIPRLTSAGLVLGGGGGGGGDKAVDASAGPGGVRHQIRPIRMRHLWSDFGAWKEPFTEVYVVKFSLYSKLV